MSDNYRNNSAKTLLKELFDLCQSDSLSEDGLREILNRHGCIPNNNLNISNYNFFRVACANEKVNEGIIRCLLDYFPDAASPTDDGCSPLHSALLFNKNVTLNMVQLLIDAAPTSVRSVHEGSSLPLHCLCHNENVDEKAAYDILTVLLETYPESIRHADDEGSLPIHIACWSGSSPEFCRVLVEAYPGSERIANDYDRLPLHYACGYNTVATVECLYKLYPDAINHLSTSDGEYPIIEAIRRMWHRNNPAAAVDIVKFLLDCDPNVRLQKFQGTMSLLHYACQTADQRGRNDSNRNAALQVINLLYGACPEYVLMEDNDGWIPLHSLCYNEKVDEMTAMGILKLLLEKCPESARHVDHRGSLPIHLAAAETARSPEFCRVLIEAYPGSERITDQFGMLPLHYACLNSTVVNTAEYLYKIYPDAINLVSIEEMYPIHYAITCLCDPRNPSATVDIDIVQFLLDCDPNIKLQKFQGTMSLLHYACLFEYNDSNRNAFLRVINLLHGACPEYVRMEDDNGWMPLHYLCNNEKVDEITAWNVLMLLLEKYPESVRHADKDGSLPIHHAGTSKSPEFCHVLIEAYPGSERIADVYGRLPFHYACWENTAATIEYLYKLQTPP